ncbi:MAG: molybdopterin-dependent oxidoreductase [Blastocatellia bacterium]
MKRREFIILTGVGATGATVLSACGHPENKLIPALIPDNEYVPGMDYWKASTCAMCDAGCGIVVRTREHKANKIEGNPLHPVNRGALCARGQAGLQALYNPDRIRGPLKRTGERGSGQFEAIGWDEAIKILADKMREEKAKGHTSIFLTTETRGVAAHVATRLMEAYKSAAVLCSPLFSQQKSDNFGHLIRQPFFDIANSTYLLSFGARFLETWDSPVMHSLAYGEFRNSRGKARGRFVQVEPRMSLTAANADEWIPARSGMEGLVALALAQVMAREGLSRTPLSPEFVKSLEDFAPEKISEAIDVPAEKLTRIAREFATAEHPLAINTASLDYSGKTYNSWFIDSLNALVNNSNRKGGVFRPEQTRISDEPLEKLLVRNGFTAINPAQCKDQLSLFGNSPVLLLHQVNLLHVIPEILETLKALPFIASFSSFMDETTEMADLILPDHVYLESWDVNSHYPTNAGRVVNLTQPVVKPEFDTRQTADVLIALGRELGGESAAAIPFASTEEIVKQITGELSKGRGSIKAENSEDFQKAFAERGVWTAEAEASPQTITETASFKLPPVEILKEVNQTALQQSSGEEYTMDLIVYEQAALGDGSFANLPRLQELPDPMTGVMWGSWIEINPKTAASLGIADGELVEVTTQYGSVRAPAVLYPAIRPDTIAMPFGQGHTAYGRYAKGRGANAALLLSPFRTQAGVETSVRARVTKAAGESNLIRFGTDLLEKIENDRSR